MESKFATRPFFRNTLFLACLAAFDPAAALAQDHSQGLPTDAKMVKRLQTVTVTGSHLSNLNITSPTPLVTLTAEDIKATGATNIGDLVVRLPQFAADAMGSSSRGMIQPNLRILGVNRTLTLINGHRAVGSSAGGTSVDINMIPTDWVERVEVITGGASAVYGADAIAGVVNFILKKNYRGVNLHTQLDTSQHGGFRKELFSLSGGMDFAGDRGNVAASIEHSGQDPVEFRDRFGHQAYSTILTPDGPTDKALFPNAGNYTYNDAGTFSIGRLTDVAKRYIFNPDGSVRRQLFHGPYDTRGYCADCDSADLNEVLQLQSNFKRTTLSSLVNFDITPEQHLYAEGAYNHVDVTEYGQPAFGSDPKNYLIKSDNAFITPSLAKLMVDNHIDHIKVSRLDTDAGRRGSEIARNTAQLGIGARGSIAGDWQYDAALNYGATDETRHNLNNRINDRFYASIDAVKDAKGNVVCRSSLQPGSLNATTGTVLKPIALNGACVPTSIFGAGAINPAAARWFNTTTTTTSRITQVVGGGTVTNNNLFRMPFDAGAASFAAGLEFRRETSRQITDPLDIAGLTFANAVPPFGGAYDVREGYVETALPLLTNHTLVKGLTFDAAARFSAYNTIGHTKTWRWGVDWAIDDDVRLRGTMSSAVRAPNIGELYKGQFQGYFGLTDPCSVAELKNGRDRAVRTANCLSLGVPAGWTSTRSATIAGLSGSNPDLKPEQGRTWTAGMVLTPQFLPGFGMAIDYWNIRLTDAITTIGGSDTAAHCVDSTAGIDNPYCSNARRDLTTHELVFIKTVKQNISELATSGVDIGAYYAHPLSGGQLRWNINATKLIDYTDHPFQEDPRNTVQEKGTQAHPAWRMSLGTTYTYGRWSINWATRYSSSTLRVSNESYKANPKQTTPIRYGAGFFNDAHVAYSFGGWQVYAGVGNVFDRNPPVGEFIDGMYDTTGRAYYAGFNYKF